jgi:hypothetical protein
MQNGPNVVPASIVRETAAFLTSGHRRGPLPPGDTTGGMGHSTAADIGGAAQPGYDTDQ